MTKFYVLWTYSANYSKIITVTADTAEQACTEATGYYSSDFQAKATVYVFDHPPTFIKTKGRSA